MPKRGSDRNLKILEQQCIETLPYVSTYLIQRLGIPAAQADDAVQEVLTRLTDQILRGDDLKFLKQEDTRALISYLIKGSLHRYLDQLRRRKWEVSDDVTILQALDPSIDVENASIRADRLRLLEEQIKSLHPPYDRIFHLFLEGLTLAEIARKLKTSRGSIYTQFQRGVALLRRGMGNAG